MLNFVFAFRSVLGLAVVKTRDGLRIIECDFTMGNEEGEVEKDEIADTAQSLGAALRTMWKGGDKECVMR